MTTKRESILTAIRTALTGTTGVGTRIYRSRVEPMAREESPALVVEPIQPVSVTFNLVEADQPAGVIMCDYLVIYRTSSTNLAA